MAAFHDILAVLSGVFLVNAMPHFVSGVMGRWFQSPFAKPPGRGLSSPTVNVLWGFANLVVGVLLARRLVMGALGDELASGVGVLAGGLLLARVFAPSQGGSPPSS